MDDGTGADQPPQPQDTELDFDSAMSDSYDLASAPQSAAPYMIGDLFGVGSNFFLGYNSVGGGVSANLGMPLGGGRRLKIGESTSPIPRDRLVFTYNGFFGPYTTQAVGGGIAPPGGFPDDGGPIGGGGGPGGNPGPPSPGSRTFDVHRFTFGYERTFFDGWTSVEMRIPFASTLGNNLFASETIIPGEQSIEFDNISCTFKSLLTRSERFATSAGLVVNMPTAQKINIQQEFNDAESNSGPSTLGHRVVVENDAVHLSPFLGWLYTPNDQLFFQGFVQWDVPVNDNATTFTPIVDGQSAGAPIHAQLDDQVLLQVDVALGYWMYRNPNAWITGLAPIVEAHYTSTMDDSDVLQFRNTAGGTDYQAILGNTLNRLDIWNLTLGAVMQIGSRVYVTNGFVIPLGEMDNGSALFDWEYSLQINYRLGSQPFPGGVPGFN